MAHGTVRVRTFHALGRQVLRDAGVDVTRLAERSAVIERLAGGPLPPATMRILDDAFTRLTLDPERGPPPTEVHIHAAYAAYRAALAADSMIDMDDLVAGALQVLRSDPAALALWRSRARVLLVDESQDLDRTQLELALLLAGDARDIFLVGDDDQTIYAWRLADVRRILDLAARLPGLRRVDLTTNYRCPPEVVHRAARLVGHVTERFVKRIDAAPRATGSLVLAPDPGDDVARARRLLGAWYGRDPGGYAILARTNGQLAPFAAVAVEQGIPFRVEQDGLRLDDPAIDAFLDRVARDGRDGGPILLRVAAAAATAQDDETHELGRVVLGWAASCATLDSLRSAVARARQARTPAARRTRPPGAGDGARHQGPGVRPCGGGRHGRGRLPQRPVGLGGPGSGPRAG